MGFAIIIVPADNPAAIARDGRSMAMEDRMVALADRDALVGIADRLRRDAQSTD
ncbi:hypothetical protein [Roseomonas sp. CECT 9278]|uniref:hypothetical protein n=1 Tax=Roseomonas sp. CECT 9278 TaxID=2845823 RepID=UPI001E58C9E8|nr:hypothetical protein [Roseomonas sp. CECT 9278]CAH0201477.1 hypothetical protein ROS9278_01933 [Roseomonas sp. CECT 9278]